MYIPNPIDTSGIVLDGELLALMEELAKNVHETWAAERAAQGWKYGKERSDTGKTTPCMVPYEELDESERDYDRNTALATIKFIIAAGYTIKKADK